MSTVNKAIILGRLGKDPEVKYMQNGNAVCNLTLATSEKYTDKSGEKVEKTEWHNVTLYGKTAETAGKYLTKGRLLYVEGKISTRKWQDKDGVDKYTTEIIGRDITFISDGNKQQNSSVKSTSEVGQLNNKEEPVLNEDFEDDFGVPF